MRQVHILWRCAQVLLAVGACGLSAAAWAQCVTPSDGLAITTDTLLCPGSYYLPNGFSIAADGVTVEGDQTAIYGDGVGNGLAVDGHQQVTVRDITIRAYYNGMHFRNCDNVTIESCTVAETYNDCQAQPCVFLDIFDDPEGPGNDYGHALWLRYCDHAVIRYNQVGDQQNGISLFDCDDALVEYNEASNNNGWGITLYDTNHSTIQHNIANDCIRVGSGHLGGDAAALLMVMGSSYNQVLDNTFLRGGDGLFLTGYRYLQLPCANNYFARNDCSESPNNGFEATFSYGNVFEDNVSDRCNYGYWLGYSWQTEVRQNQIRDCYAAGIAIEHGNTNVIEDNILTGNYVGIYLWTDLDDDLVGAYPELKDSHTYQLTHNVLRQNNFGIICEALGSDRYSYDYTIVDNRLDANAYGVMLTLTTDSALRSNFIRNNTTAGVVYWSCSGVTTYNNYFYGNASNAQDYDYNTWNVAKTAGTTIVGGAWLGGNYWSDYAGADTDGDGLGDTDLPHKSGGKILHGGDYLPLVWDDPDCNQNGVPDATEPDCNGNGQPDDCDLAAGSSLDCNANGVPDDCDLAAGTSLDSNGDGIPDDCQDCNNNGVPDPVDLAGGTSADCNANGVPDECDLASGASQDCNANALPDECDISSGRSDDCNDTGTPDECEVAPVHGLLGTYFDNPDFTGRAHARVDAVVNFVWGNLPPWPDFGADTFSIRWLGLVHTSAAGTYTFYTFTDDGVRLWVNGRKIIDRWVDQGPTEVAGTITLNADTDYALVLEYYENSGWALASLSWQPPGAAKTVIPTDRLVPDRDCDGSGRLDRCDIAGGLAPDCNGNNVPDACDIAEGTSLDLNGDGLPDECADCNSNGVPDWQDIVAGTSADCNANGVPDECEPDCNGNGTPDDCDLAGRIAFSSPVQYSAVPGAIWLAVGDLGSDGFADIAVATSSTSERMWLLYNDGQGAFPAHGYTGVATSEHGVLIEDVDGDGRRDLVIAENSDRYVRILRNLGSGNFQEVQLLSVAADPVSLAAADMDGDGDPDLVVGYWGPFVSVLKNQGDGLFAPPVYFPAGPIAYVVALGDVDHDSDPDVVVANLTNILVLENDGGGSLAAPVTYPAGGSAACVVLADLDRDGWLDIAAANEYHDSVSVFLNQGDGTFGPAATYTAGANSRFLAAGDFNRDGNIDLVTANAQAPYLSVFRNQGDGTFAGAASVSLPTSTRMIAVGRLDANDSDDLVAAQSGDGVVVLLNAAPPTSPDCNANGVPDECDVASGHSSDVNHNQTPDECESVGDLNCDGSVDFGDINPFVRYLTNFASWQAKYPGCSPLNGDINGDGTYGQGAFGDINPFVALLTGGG